MKHILPVIAGTALFAVSAQAQLFNFTTFAGSAALGNLDGVTNVSEFNNPGGVAKDISGNIYVADTGDNTIRKIAPNGTVSTLAGSPGISGGADGNGTNALFNAPQGIAVDSSGNVYVADTGNDTIRKITTAGVVSTLAGLAGNAGSANGSGTNASFYEPEGLAVDAAGNIFVADTWNDTIREVSPSGTASTIAGSPGNFGSTNGVGASALFYEPGGVAVDASDDVFVADTGNNVIREIVPGGTVTTLAGSVGNFGYTNATGTNALFNAPQGIAIDSSGNLYVADYLNNAIRKVTSAGVVISVAGSPGNFGSADGSGTNDLFWGPESVIVDPNNNNLVYVADTGNSVVRQISIGIKNLVSTYAGNASAGSADATGTSARLFWPMDVASDGHGNFYVADAQNDTIRKIAANGTVSTFAGFPGMIGNVNATGTNASFNDPQAVAVDGSGNVYVADTGNSIIREITPGGVVSTLAGSPGNVGSSDGTGSSAQFNAPQGIAVNGSGVFVADTMNHTIREITSGGVVTTFAGFPGNFGSADGTNSAAQFDRPVGLAIDSNGNLFVADLFNHTIREVTPAGVVSTIAGLARVFGDSDGTNCAASFFEPEGIAVGSGDTVYVADAGNDSVRQLTPSGTNWIVTTIAGWPGESGSQDGSGIVARFCYPAGMAVSGGDLFLADSANNTIRSGSMITDHPPTISTQPQSQAVMFGSPATFSVSASGQGALYYQWFFDGTEIPGATGSTYYLANAQSANAGTYSVLINSGLGSILSSNALLTVYTPPEITGEPVSQTCLQGSTVTFSVTASGTGPLTYQWEENGHPLSNSGSVSGANTAILTLSSVTTASSATYSVVVTGAYGGVSSSPATLTVFYVPPADSTQPTAWWLLNEGTGTVAFDYSGNGHTGTINPGVSWTSAGYSGTGAYFDGTTGGDIAIGSPFTVSANWTATMWVNRWGTKNSSVLVGGSSYALKLEQASDSSHVGYTWYSHTDYELNYVTPINSWVHLAFVETSAGVSLYTNGVLAASLANTASLNATTIGFGLPAATTDYLDATLNDVRLYSQALTQGQISNIYAYGRITPIPTAMLTSPTNGEAFVESSNITLSANVVANGQSVSAVQYYQGSTLLGQATTAPYTFTWTNVPAGSYSLTANVVYSGGTAVSPAVGIYVGIATNSPSLNFSTANGNLQLSWPPDHTGWELEVQTNSPAVGLSSNWTILSNSVSTNAIVIPISPANGNVFYRLVYPE